MSEKLKFGITSAGDLDGSAADAIMGVFTHTFIDADLQFADPEAEVTIIHQTWDRKALEKELLELDGVIMTGGYDIWPGMYGATEIHPRVDPHDPRRDWFDWNVIDIVLEHDIPFLAVCRGSQMVNVYHGGTLYQDLEDEYKDLSPKQIFDWSLLSRINHDVTIVDGPLVELFGKDAVIGVNTGHHQAVKDVGDKLKVAAVSEDGLVESTFRPDKKFFLGVQWHPEFMFGNENARKTIKFFVDKCREFGGK